jgi:hypothetical protein
MGFIGLGMVVTVCETIKILLLYGNRKLEKEGAEAREKEKKWKWLLLFACVRQQQSRYVSELLSPSDRSIVPLKRWALVYRLGTL